MVRTVFRLHIRGAVLSVQNLLLCFAYGAITLYRGTFQSTSAHTVKECVHATSRLHFWDDSDRPVPSSVARTNGILTYLFLRLLRRFNSAGSLSRAGRIPKYAADTSTTLRRECEVALGNPGFEGNMRLPRAYRCLPRPS